jgi:hypothetical protein
MVIRSTVPTGDHISLEEALQNLASDPENVTSSSLRVLAQRLDEPHSSKLDEFVANLHGLTQLGLAAERNRSPSN